MIKRFIPYITIVLLTSGFILADKSQSGNEKMVAASLQSTQVAERTLIVKDEQAVRQALQEWRQLYSYGDRPSGNLSSMQISLDRKSPALRSTASEYLVIWPGVPSHFGFGQKIRASPFTVVSMELTFGEKSMVNGGLFMNT
jgi:hypothetical protein